MFPQPEVRARMVDLSHKVLLWCPPNSDLIDPFTMDFNCFSAHLFIPGRKIKDDGMILP
jgi:hypothetical protein